MKVALYAPAPFHSCRPHLGAGLLDPVKLRNTADFVPVSGKEKITHSFNVS